MEWSTGEKMKKNWKNCGKLFWCTRQRCETIKYFNRRARPHKALWLRHQRTAGGLKSKDTLGGLCRLHGAGADRSEEARVRHSGRRVVAGDNFSGAGDRRVSLQRLQNWFWSADQSIRLRPAGAARRPGLQRRVPRLCEAMFNERLSTKTKVSATARASIPQLPRKSACRRAWMVPSHHARSWNHSTHSGPPTDRFNIARGYDHSTGRAKQVSVASDHVWLKAMHANIIISR